MALTQCEVPQGKRRQQTGTGHLALCLSLALQSLSPASLFGAVPLAGRGSTELQGSVGAKSYCALKRGVCKDVPVVGGVVVSSVRRVVRWSRSSRRNEGAHRQELAEKKSSRQKKSFRRPLRVLFK